MGFFYSQLYVTPEYPVQSFARQTVIVTGSNVGLGLEAARHIARLGADKVILAVRNVAAGEEAQRSIEQSTGSQNVCEVWKLDLASYSSVKEFALRASRLTRLDVVLANAALAPSQFTRAEGHERSITVNVISTMLLGLLLLPKLNETASKFPDSHHCLSFVTSEVHAWTSLPERQNSNIFATLDNEETTDIGQRYPTSKLLEVLLIRELVARMPAHSRVVVNMLNPGFCHSQLGRDSSWGTRLVLSLMRSVLARSTDVGSRTLVAGAAGGAESHGAYMTDGKVANDALSPFVQSSEGEKTQRRLWGELEVILEEVQPGVMRNVAG